jgi:hypothetical protein
MLGVFHKEHDGKVLEHRVQEVPRLFELGGAARQRFFRPPVLGDLAFQLGLGLARSRAVVRVAAPS